MPRSSFMLSTAHRARTALTASLCLAALAIPMVASQGTAAAATALPTSDAFRPSADIGFHDWTRDGTEREIRNDLTGDLGAMVEFAQESTVDPTGNAANEMPTLVADRVALLMVTPTSDVASLSVDVYVKGVRQGTVDLAHPNQLPDADQTFDSRGTVAYSLRAWSVELPYEWVQAGLTLTVNDDQGRSGTLEHVDVEAPKELVINNIRLGMLTDAPESSSHRFITDPVASATDYFQTIPIAKLTMAQYETVELDEVIVSSGAIYDVDNPDPSIGSVYAGKMREDVGKAQVSTGINLATWGITSSAMSQRQPGYTNQRVIHHSAGLYKNEGRQVHGLSGGNGMATLYSSTGNELSHELGHSYGLGHYPGRDTSLEGDAAIRNSMHHMDSGWGYIAYRGLMRSNLSAGAYKETDWIEGSSFTENLAGKYNFNHDTMAGGWDASPVSEYTHMTGYSLKRTQAFLQNLVADTDFPSGYRNWDSAAGEWVDAKVLDPDFALQRPAEIGVPVFTVLGGYNPANTDQTLIYDGFRSNYGVTFDLPQADVNAVSDARVCWLEVDFDGADTQHIAIDATDGVKQVNVNIAESARPTGAQIGCRVNGTTTMLGNEIEIATDLEPMPAAVVVGEEAGFEALRAKELAALNETLEALADAPAPVLSANDMLILTGWSDDLSPLSATARTVAERILKLHQDAEDVEAYLLQHGGIGVTAADLPELASFLTDNGYVGADGEIVPAGTAVTVNSGRCLYTETGDLRVDDAADCADAHDETWFVDVAGRIHSAQNPGLCITYKSPVGTASCSLTDVNQRWVLNDNTTVVRSANAASAMDYNRKTSFVTTYGLSGTTNQFWIGFEKNSNPLLAYLGPKGLAAFSGTLDIEKAPEPETPAEEIPTEEPPAEEGPVEELPEEPVTGGIGDAVGGTPADGPDAPAEEGPSEELPAEENPAEEPATGGTPADGPDAPTEDAPTEEGPAEELPEEPVTGGIGDVVGGTPTDGPDAPADENPADENPADENPAAEVPDDEPVTGGIGDVVGGTPTDDSETPSTDAPSTDTPSTETPGAVGGDHVDNGAGADEHGDAHDGAATPEEPAAGGIGAAVGADSELATTGGSPAWIALGSALVLLLAGASLLMFRRARTN